MNYIIRTILVGAVSLLLTSACASSEEKKYQPLELWYESPAETWTDALPVGNGRLGAMVYGGTDQEHIQFNEETLWTGEPQSYARKGAWKYLDEIQSLLFAGKQEEAHKLAQENFMSTPLQQRAYQPFGDLYLQFNGHSEYTSYKRRLDLSTAIHHVSYNVGETSYNREMFVSKPDEVIALKLTTNKEKALSFSFWLDAAHKQKEIKIVDNQISLDVKVSDGVSNWFKHPYKSVLYGNAKITLSTNGKVRKEGDKLIVEEASNAVLYLTAATNYKNYKEVSNVPEIIVNKHLNKVAGSDFEQLKDKHISDYSPMFNRFSIDFGQNEKANLPTNERLELFNDSIGDPGLVSLYVQYGRYLMLACSREGTNPANLQGIWNDQLNPAWDSKYTTNINCEMNYWLPEVTNLSECHEPLFKLINEVAESGAITAKEHYNANGWIVHHNTDIWRGTAPIYSATHGIFLGGGGWLSHHLWERYLYTKDEEFLRERAYPIMKSSAQFYNDMLIADPKTGWLVSSPSNSPETGGLVYGPSMDHQIIRSLFKACVEATKVLQIDSHFASNLELKLMQIAPDQIGQHGQLQEWVEDKDDIESKHRHVSHLWGVYPGKEITWDNNPDMMKAAIQSLKFRGNDGTGWSLAWKINFWARFLDGDHAYELVKMLFRPVNSNKTTYGAGGGSYNNLFDAHPPFQIDGNFGAPVGIIEMLMQSHMEYIHILPALPSALADGKIQGVCTRGAFELDFQWKEGKLLNVKVKSKAGGHCTLKYKEKIVSFDTKKGNEYRLDGELNREV